MNDSAISFLARILAKDKAETLGWLAVMDCSGIVTFGSSAFTVTTASVCCEGISAVVTSSTFSTGCTSFFALRTSCIE
ncbi:hypothetical protein [Flavobacterium sp.]|uniref:hypothetical protein n=1 Tax=Flavobacterium sp. TaxID=239 RepID=UPI002FD93177